MRDINITNLNEVNTINIDSENDNSNTNDETAKNININKNYRTISAQNDKININNNNENDSLLDLIDTEGSSGSDSVTINDESFVNRIKHTLTAINAAKIEKENLQNKIHLFTDDGRFKFKEKLIPVESTEFSLKEAQDLSSFKNFHPKYFFKETVKD